VWGLVAIVACTAQASAQNVEAVLRQLNSTSQVKGTDDIKTYKVLFPAYLELQPPPMPIGPGFNHLTIHPGMPQWTKVSGWAESNPKMAEAILQAEERTILGLPYGTDDLESEFRQAGLVAEIGIDGNLRNNAFTYLDAMGTVVAYATAEVYRRMEAGDAQGAIDLLRATMLVTRQQCDREFLIEKEAGITMLTDILSIVRDFMYRYQDGISGSLFTDIAYNLPYLRPDRNALLIPEGDRVLSEAIIEDVFDSGGQADREKFAAAFAAVQSADAPLTRFGAARRWRLIAEVHDSKDISLERLQLIYDDWYRRWRVEEHDPILDVPTEFERTNPVRYAAVVFSVQNIESLCDDRNVLMAAVNGTAMAAGLCGYRKEFGNYPSDVEKTYATYVRKRSNKDPYDLQFGEYRYRMLRGPWLVNWGTRRVDIEKIGCILYSRGRNHEDGRGRTHTDDGSASDMVMWPPLRAVAREQGLLE
jgi:hypothetical protein